MSSDSLVKVVKIKEINPHPNADKIAFHIIKDLENYPVLSQKGNFNIEDLAIYIPVDMICPNTEEFAFLGKKESDRRIKAKKIRGEFSMGLLIPIPKDIKEQAVEGMDVTELLGFKKWDPDDDSDKVKMSGTILSGDCESNPKDFIIPYYDIENVRKMTKYLDEFKGDIILTEKIHGANAAYVYWDRLWIKSRTRYKKLEGFSDWNKVATDYNLEQLLSNFPHKVLFGEIYGKVQHLKYNKPNEVDFIVFDVLNLDTHKFLDWPDYLEFINKLNEVAKVNGWKKLKTTPLLYKGPWIEFQEIKKYAEGTTLLGASHCREGFVLRPEKETYTYKGERVVYKLIGEGYMLK